MGTGKYVNFHNADSGDDFNITLDSAGHLDFRANDTSGAGDLRMSILDDTNEVSFDGSITVAQIATIGGSGDSGGLQLKTDDGDNTIFLGTTDTEAHALLGTNGRSGRIELKDGDAVITVDMTAGNGLGGEINVSNVDGQPFVTMAGG